MDTDYVNHCTYLGIRPHSAVLKLLRQRVANKDGDSTVSIDASNNALGDVGLLAAVDVFASGFPRVQTVDVSGNALTDSSVSVLCRALQRCRALRCLDLRRNHLTQACVPTLRSFALKHSVQIDISGNDSCFAASVAFLGKSREISVPTAAAGPRAPRRLLAKHSELFTMDFAASAHRLELLKAIPRFNVLRHPTASPDGALKLTVFVSAPSSGFHAELELLQRIVVPQINWRLRKLGKDVFLQLVSPKQSFSAGEDLTEYDANDPSSANPTTIPAAFEPTTLRGFRRAVQDAVTPDIYLFLTPSGRWTNEHHIDWLRMFAFGKGTVLPMVASRRVVDHLEVTRAEFGQDLAAQELDKESPEFQWVHDLPAAFKVDYCASVRRVTADGRPDVRLDTVAPSGLTFAHLTSSFLMAACCHFERVVAGDRVQLQAASRWSEPRMSRPRPSVPLHRDTEAETAAVDAVRRTWREQLLRMTDAVVTSPKSIVVIDGPPGSGRSHWLRLIEDELAGREDTAAVVRLSGLSAWQTGDAKYVLRSILRACDLPDHVVALSGLEAMGRGEPNAPFARFLQCIRKVQLPLATRRQGLFVLVDDDDCIEPLGLSSMAVTLAEKDAALLTTEDGQSPIRFVLTSRKLSTSLAPFVTRLPLGVVVDSMEAATAVLIDTWPTGPYLGARASIAQVAAYVHSRKADGSHPRFLALAAIELARRSEGVSMMNIAEALPSTLPELTTRLVNAALSMSADVELFVRVLAGHMMHPNSCDGSLLAELLPVDQTTVWQHPCNGPLRSTDALNRWRRADLGANSDAYSGTCQRFQQCTATIALLTSAFPGLFFDRRPRQAARSTIHLESSSAASLIGPLLDHRVALRRHRAGQIDVDGGSRLSAAAASALSVRDDGALLRQLLRAASRVSYLRRHPLHREGQGLLSLDAITSGCGPQLVLSALRTSDALERLVQLLGPAAAGRPLDRRLAAYRALLDPSTGLGYLLVTHPFSLLSLHAPSCLTCLHDEAFARLIAADVSASFDSPVALSRLVEIDNGSRDNRYPTLLLRLDGTASSARHDAAWWVSTCRALAVSWNHTGAAACYVSEASSSTPTDDPSRLQLRRFPLPAATGSIFNGVFACDPSHATHCAAHVIVCSSSPAIELYSLRPSTPAGGALCWSLDRHLTISASQGAPPRVACAAVYVSDLDGAAVAVASPQAGTHVLSWFVAAGAGALCAMTLCEGLDSQASQIAFSAAGQKCCGVSMSGKLCVWASGLSPCPGTMLATTIMTGGVPRDIRFVTAEAVLAVTTTQVTVWNSASSHTTTIIGSLPLPHDDGSECPATNPVAPRSIMVTPLPAEGGLRILCDNAGCWEELRWSPGSDDGADVAPGTAASLSTVTPLFATAATHGGQATTVVDVDVRDQMAVRAVLWCDPHTSTSALTLEVYDAAVDPLTKRHVPLRQLAHIAPRQQSKVTTGACRIISVLPQPTTAAPAVSSPSIPAVATRGAAESAVIAFAGEEGTAAGANAVHVTAWKWRPGPSSLPFDPRRAW